MERRVQEADGDRIAVHLFEQSLEVALLIRHDLVQRLLAVLGVVRNDHLTHRLDAVASKNMCSVRQRPMPLRRTRELVRVTRGIRIGANLSLRYLSAQPMNRPKSPAMEAGAAGMASP